MKLNKTTENTRILNIRVSYERKIGDQEITDFALVKVFGEQAENLAPLIYPGTYLLCVGDLEIRGFKNSDGSVAGLLILHATKIEHFNFRTKGEKTQVDCEFLDI